MSTLFVRKKTTAAMKLTLEKSLPSKWQGWLLQQPWLYMVYNEHGLWNGSATKVVEEWCPRIDLALKKIQIAKSRTQKQKEVETIFE